VPAGDSAGREPAGQVFPDLTGSGAGGAEIGQLERSCRWFSPRSPDSAPGRYPVRSGLAPGEGVPPASSRWARNGIRGALLGHALARRCAAAGTQPDIRPRRTETWRARSTSGAVPGHRGMPRPGIPSATQGRRASWPPGNSKAQQAASLHPDRSATKSSSPLRSGGPGAGCRNLANAFSSARGAYRSARSCRRTQPAITRVDASRTLASPCESAFLIV